MTEIMLTVIRIVRGGLMLYNNMPEIAVLKTQCMEYSVNPLSV